MTNDTLIAMVAASLVALVCLILIIVFVVWRFKRFDKKHGKTPLKKSFWDQQRPPILMPARLNKTLQHPQDRSLVYTVQMPKQINPKQVSLISKQQSKKKTQPQKVWPMPNSIPTSRNSFVWRPIENESGPEPHKDLPKKQEEEETQGSFSDRQRKPHRGSIRHLPTREGKTKF